MSERRAVVTGGSSGIGAAICRELLGQGYEVTSLAREAAESRPGLRSVCVDLEDRTTATAAIHSLAGSFPATT
ncbi:MAG: SDR family NAD(P)-dependent oxidoreductase, partial [Gammaproteobacteria bacterium]|nr:SDR family NAD(P)-dependent oxidoreductase [Gammaproteobacteria bacterium]